MKKHLLIIPITIALAIFFYPITSNSNSTGSPGGYTSAPGEDNCTECHAGVVNSGPGTVNLTSNIPSGGYTPGDTYSITATVSQTAIDKFGFEAVAFHGDFLNINSSEMQSIGLDRITHTSGGTIGGTNGKSWAFDWVTPIGNPGTITLYAAFVAANNNSGNGGDYVYTTSLTVNEEIINSINNISAKNQIIFNSITKILESEDNSGLSVYNSEGKLILSSNKKHTNLSHLSKGTYIIQSENNTKKIILN